MNDHETRSLGNYLRNMFHVFFNRHSHANISRAVRLANQLDFSPSSVVRISKINKLLPSRYVGAIQAPVASYFPGQFIHSTSSSFVFPGYLSRSVELKGSFHAAGRLLLLPAIATRVADKRPQTRVKCPARRSNCASDRQFPREPSANERGDRKKIDVPSRGYSQGFRGLKQWRSTER